jgi:hypothetical protein
MPTEARVMKRTAIILSLAMLFAACTKPVTLEPKIEPEIEVVQPVDPVKPEPISSTDPVVLPAVDSSTGPIVGKAGEWTVVGKLQNADGLRDAVALKDGRVLFYGITSNFKGYVNGVATYDFIRHAEIFNPETGVSSEIKNYDYSKVFALDDGRVALYKTARISVFDPVTNLFQHFSIQEFSENDRFLFLESPDGNITYGQDQRDVYGQGLRDLKNLNIQTGKSTVVEYPIESVPSYLKLEDRYWQKSTVLAPRGKREVIQISPNYSDQPQSLADFDSLKPYKVSVLSLTDQSFSASSSFAINLPYGITSGKMLDENTLQLVQFQPADTSSKVRYCAYFFLNIKLQKLIAQIPTADCFSYGGWGSTKKIAQDQILFYNYKSYPGRDSGRKAIFDLEAQKFTDIMQPPIPQSTNAVYRFQNGSTLILSSKYCDSSFTECKKAPDLGASDLYSPVTHKLEPVKAFNDRRNGGVSVQLPGGHVLIAAGATRDPADPSNVIPTSSVEIYTPEP